MVQAEIERLMDLVEEPAILARRPYPPIGLPEVRSQLGGLPLLRSGTDWPRASDGTPLHFLARIDCAELPHARGPLPARGVLQFFARIDADMDWGDDAAEYARVLFTDHAEIGWPTAAPADMPAIQGGWLRYDCEMRLPNEPRSRVYPHWPLVFDRIRTWPGAPSYPNTDLSGPYRDAVGRARAAEIVRTTGFSTHPLLRSTWGELGRDRDGTSIVTLPTTGADAFPQAWIIAERIARAAACLAVEESNEARTEGRSPREGLDLKGLLADLEILAEEAVEWMHRARRAGLDAAMPKADAEEFTDWLTPLSRDDRSEIQYLASRALQRGMSHAVKYCGGSPRAAALVPPFYMNCLETEHSLPSPDTMGIYVAPPRGSIGTEHHQLLGSPRDSEEILLLHLVSDKGVGFMFCDYGSIQFRIKAEDLVAGRFDRATASAQGC